MSGHSKWSKVKHQKESVDANRGKIFTKLGNAIYLAVKTGGGISDPAANFKLRLAIEKARSLNMPKENIERSIERAISSGAASGLESVVYEAIGPSGIGLIIEVATDNKQRTVAELKNILERHGCKLAGHGSVVHLFQLTGLINVPKKDISYEKILESAIDSGASDLKEAGEYYNIYTDPAALHKVTENLQNKGLMSEDSELIYKPSSPIQITDNQIVSRIQNLIKIIEDNDDIQKVYTNFIPQDKLADVNQKNR